MVGEELVALFIKLMRSGSQEEPGSIELDHVTKPFDQKGTSFPIERGTATSGNTTKFIDYAGAGTLEWILVDPASSNSSELKVDIDGVTFIDRVLPQLVLPMPVEFKTSLEIWLTAGGGGGAIGWGAYRT